ncbi:hypothetical protein ACTFIB_06840 [Staphylococcus chromogenes]|uniref:hypothetical protein n=1 Tax=Staphylococcus chromogenes TaxID=46126 RepID=UPI003EB8D0B0
MTWSEFEKYFQSFQPEVETQFGNDSEYFHDLLSELKSNNTENYSEEFLYSLAMNECSKRYSETLIYNVARQILKDDEQNQ